MRSDTKRLLERLGQPDFSYREYDESPAASTDRWPLFEVVARQLHQGLVRSVADSHDPDNAEAEAVETGTDIQSLIARIARGRAA